MRKPLDFCAFLVFYLLLLDVANADIASKGYVDVTRVAVNQGAVNANKVMITDNNGIVTPGNVANTQANWTETTATSPQYIQNKPNLAPVATSGSYNDLANKPVVDQQLDYYNYPGSTNAISNAAVVEALNNKVDAQWDPWMYAGDVLTVDQNGFVQPQDFPQSDWDEKNTSSPSYIQNKPNLAPVATSGSYNDLDDLPQIDSVIDFTNYSSTNPVENQAIAHALDDKVNIAQGAVNANRVLVTDGNGDVTLGDFPEPDTSINPQSDNAVANSAVADALADLAYVAKTGAYSDLSGTPNLATVATTGAYSDLSGTPKLADVATSGSYNDLDDKPTLGTAAATDASAYATAAQGALAATAVQPADLATVATTGSYNDLTNKPAIPDAQVSSDWNATTGVAQILNKPNLATVATSGSYNDLTNKPAIPDAQVNSDWDATSGVAQILNKPNLATVATTGAYSDLSGTPNLATVATSGSYNDLDDKPTIPAAQVSSDWNATTGVAQILNKPTTIAGYGITDAKIENGVITLGAETITPLTAHQSITGKADTDLQNVILGNIATVVTTTSNGVPKTLAVTDGNGVAVNVNATTGAATIQGVASNGTNLGVVRGQALATPTNNLHQSLLITSTGNAYYNPSQVAVGSETAPTGLANMWFE